MEEDSQSRASLAKLGQLSHQFRKYAHVVESHLQKGKQYHDAHHAPSDPAQPSAYGHLAPPPPPPSYPQQHYYPNPTPPFNYPPHAFNSSQSPPPPPPYSLPQTSAIPPFHSPQPPPPPPPPPYGLPQTAAAASSAPQAAHANGYIPNSTPANYTFPPNQLLPHPPIAPYTTPHTAHTHSHTPSSTPSLNAPSPYNLPQNLNASHNPPRPTYANADAPNASASCSLPEASPRPANGPIVPPQKPIQAPILNCSGPIVTKDLLFQMQTRIDSATVPLSAPIVIEARKGLSRLLTTTYEDLELFGNQLKTNQVQAVEPNWNTVEDQVPCFAISYVQHRPIGRFKFSRQQWQNLHSVVQALSHNGVSHFRLWIDQCLWLRDASQPSWAHSGILPYVLWPVIALGAKLYRGERTADSYVRMWPFVEEISALWGMGLIVASEYRSKDPQAGTRSWLSYNIRLRTEPEKNLMIVLRNVFHGATDGLQTGWTDDVRELKEMAVANMTHDNDDIIIGSNWKERFASIKALAYGSILGNLALPRHSKYHGGDNIYIDGSRTLQSTGWNGLTEWLSGNEGPLKCCERDLRRAYIGLDKYNVITDNHEYQLLRIGGSTKVIWLLVAMQGRSSYFSRGRVAWTKVLTGLSSCTLGDIMSDDNIAGLQRVLREQIGKSDLKVVSAASMSSSTTIEWV